MSTDFKDYYKILGVDRKATDAEIKTAYRKLARKHHPDLHAKGDKAAAEEKFKEVNEAYAVLSDAEKRAQYDLLGEDGGRSRQQWQQPPPYRRSETGSQQWQDAESGDFSDFFASLFGGQRSARPARTQDLTSDLELTLEEAYHGGIKNLHFSISGSSGTPVDKKLDVRIPPFVREGSKIRLKGQGAPGDLILTVRILPHTCYTLKGNTLETIVKIFPEQAVLGGQVAVPTMDGEVMMTLPPMSHNGQKLRLREKGWLDKDGKRGDEFVKIAIDIPRTLKPEEQEIYQNLAKLRKGK